jgi:hypothetical protein
LLTSERRRFLGSSFAVSGGSTTCLKEQSETNKKKNTIFHQKKKEKKTDERKWRGWWVPVLVGVVEVLLGVLDLTHFSNTRGFDASQLDLRKLRRFGKREMKWTIELFARQKVPKKHLMKYREKESEK